MTISPEDIDRVATVWIIVPQVEAVTRMTLIPLETVKANLAAITERACFLKAEQARRTFNVRVCASRKAAKTKAAMKAARLRHG